MNTDKAKKITYFVTGLVFVFALSAFLIAKNFNDPKIFGPIITFMKEKQDFGNVKQGPQLEGTFEFTNTGRDKLIIKSVSTSCGCTGAIVDGKKEYMPGEEGRIKFTFNTEGRSGINEKSITVESNDMKNPHKTVSFTCNIVQ
jgi:hypothetical protein